MKNKAFIKFQYQFKIKNLQTNAMNEIKQTNAIAMNLV